MALDKYSEDGLKNKNEGNQNKSIKIDLENANCQLSNQSQTKVVST